MGYYDAKGLGLKRAPGGFMDERLEALETKLTYQERAIAELSSEVYGQAARLRSAEELLRSMAEKLKEMAGDGSPLPPGERPPHY
jgi:uncharacterized coiled-coil protein SlyX